MLVPPNRVALNPLDVPVAEMDHRVRNGRGFVAMSRHQDAHLSFTGGSPEQLHDDISTGGVQVADRLVREKHFRRMDQRAGNRDPLHLPAGKLMRQPPRVRFHFHPSQAFQRIVPAGRLPGQHQRKLNVLDSAQCREQIEELEDEADFPPADLREAAVIESGSVCIVEENTPRRRKVHGARKVQQGRFSAAAAPHERDKLTLGYLERDAVEGQNTFVVSLVFLGDAF